jgi:hypothetical protein
MENNTPSRQVRRAMIRQQMKKNPELAKASYNAGYIKGQQDENKRIVWAALYLKYEMEPTNAVHKTI